MFQNCSRVGAIAPTGRQFCKSKIAANCFCFGLVVIATTKHPIPSRTRPLRAVTPMVLRLKTWESRSPPNLTKNRKSIYNTKQYTNRPRRNARAVCVTAGRKTKPNLTKKGISQPLPKTSVRCPRLILQNCEPIAQLMQIDRTVDARSHCATRFGFILPQIFATWSLT